MDNVARATALMAQRDHIRPGASVAFRLDVYMEMADTLPGLVAEVERLRDIEAAARQLADALPPNGAATPHTPLVLGEYRTALLYNLRDLLGDS